MTEFLRVGEWAVEFLPQFITAVVCGLAIGYERQRHGGHIGMLTCVMVCVGATTYMSASHLILATSGLAGDPTRVASQIITGIGFLGAGTIIRGADGVGGLTSAATIWFIGAVGILVGCRLPLAGLLLTLAVIAVSTITRRLETMVRTQSSTSHRPS